MKFLKFSFVLLHSIICSSALAYTECEKSLMDTYLAYRSALLDVNYATNKVLKTLSPNFKEKFKSEADLRLFLVALRVKEAKIIRLDEFSAKCADQEGEIHLKILFYEPEYDRLIVSIVKQDGRYYVNATTFQSDMEGLDVHYQYQPIKIDDRLSASLINQ